MNRKEAIEVIKKNYPHVGISGSEFETALRELVPDLAGSEDEKIRRELLNHCLKAASGQTLVVSTEDYYRWASWLEKQKPAELSEEDERMLNRIVDVVEDYQVDDCFEKEIEWLKSLRPQPHWKPSEEQMRELRNVISGCSHETSVLVSLENDLKKLM